MSILLKYQSDLSIHPLIQSIFPIQLLIFSHLFLNHLMLQYYFIKFSHNFDLSFNILHSMSLNFLYLNLHIIMVTVMTNDYYQNQVTQDSFLNLTNSRIRYLHALIQNYLLLYSNQLCFNFMIMKYLYFNYCQLMSQVDTLYHQK